MKRLRLLIALALCAAAPFVIPPSAHVQAVSLINCAPSTPCDPATGPIATGTGDPSWAAFGKLNTDLNRAWAWHLTCSPPLACTGAGVISANPTLSLGLFAGSTPGSVPTSVGGTTNYLRADGAWSAPAGGGGGGSSTTMLDVTKSPYNAVANRLSYSDAVMTSGSAALASASATFSAGDVGKLITVDNAGVAGGPLVTTIAGYTNAHAITLGTAASTSVPYTYAWSLSNTAGAAGTACVPGGTLTATGGTGTATVGTVIACSAVSATLNAAGTGGVNGSCVLQSTTGAGTAAYRINATVAGGAVTALGSFVTGGSFSTNPTLTGGGVTGCGTTGTTVDVVMGAYIINPSTRGSYTTKPASPVTFTGGGASGFTASPAWITTGNFAYGTSAVTGINAAIVAANAINAAGGEACVYLPAGVYTIDSALVGATGGVTFYQTSGCIKGDGPYKTWLVATPNWAGDVLSFSENWEGIQKPPVNGGIRQLVGHADTVIVRDLSILGDLLSTAQQNGMALYDHQDGFTMDHVMIEGFNGSAFRQGDLKNATKSAIRESTFDFIRTWRCGSAVATAGPSLVALTNHPCVLFGSQGTSGDGDNQIKIFDWSVFGNFGTGFQITAQNGTLGTDNTLFYMTAVRVEGIQNYPQAIPFDLFVLGGTAATSTTKAIYCRQCQFTSPYLGQYAVRLDAGSTAAQPYQVSIDGNISGGDNYGGGLIINYGRNNTFNFADIVSDAPNVTVAATAGGSNQISGPAARENAWTYSVAGPALKHPQLCASAPPAC